MFVSCIAWVSASKVSLELDDESVDELESEEDEEEDDDELVLPLARAFVLLVPATAAATTVLLGVVVRALWELRPLDRTAPKLVCGNFC